MSEQSVRAARKARGEPSAPGGRKWEKKMVDQPADVSGIFKDDPLWDEFIEAMRRARAEEDAREDVSG